MVLCALMPLASVLAVGMMPLLPLLPLATLHGTASMPLLRRFALMRSCLYLPLLSWSEGV